MLVDPELLRAFAKQVDDAAAVIAGIDVDGAATAAADGIGGSLTQWAAHQVGPHLGAAAKDIADDVLAMATAVRGAGDTYEVQDHILSDSFDGLF
ncbi:type VII secretion target [Mycolicibacterium thermoresistibile]|uniref:Uncharacterized protein n=1 Tax=Mycolicibacterium thermoresistibile TaxID=1797 RepID=A0A100XE06_MYCTH|nr:type VII secretion target [Mycolicibacterium thermoresistibile]MCV7188936.1 hypothetical protein [Mycolicibacterium thermoresistibile]GAT14880.1 uncharacterized protein RMCT_1850 [Mycolicibacterium thermoresistibile]